LSIEVTITESAPEPYFVSVRAARLEDGWKGGSQAAPDLDRLLAGHQRLLPSAEVLSATRSVHEAPRCSYRAIRRSGRQVC
jgi:hypothetical protein